jgi:hypothetical protein
MNTSCRSLPPLCRASNLLTVECNGSSQASDPISVLGEYIGEDGVSSLWASGLAMVRSTQTRKSVSQHTGGISLGKSTSFVNVNSPFLSGHSRSTCPTCSHKSVSWLMRVINPYLTWMCTFAPSSTSFVRLPLAEMLRPLPLFVH